MQALALGVSFGRLSKAFYLSLLREISGYNAVLCWSMTATLCRAGSELQLHGQAPAGGFLEPDRRAFGGRRHHCRLGRDRSVRRSQTDSARLYQ